MIYDYVRFIELAIRWSDAIGAAFRGANWYNNAFQVYFKVMGFV